MGLVEAAHNVNVLGSGNNTVVIGHGFGTDQSVWRYLVPHLVDEYKVVLYDNMGSGSTNPDYFDFERYDSLEGYAYDLLVILEELKVDSCIYVGHSLSSMTGVISSIFRPYLFKKIILISASPRFLNTDDYYGGFEMEDINQLCNAIETNYNSWVSGFAPLVVGGDMDSPVVREFSRTLFNMRPDITLSVFRTIFTFDFRDFLSRVSVPCHIIQSTKDLAVPVAVGEYLKKNFGGRSVVEIVSTEGHLPQLSAPEVIVPVIVNHIRRDVA